MIVYVSIGNSDDHLTQAEWSNFWIEMSARVASVASITHGVWFSNPAGPWQNACWCLEFADSTEVEEAREAAVEIRKKYRQDSIAWAEVPDTQFI
jgi:hypothetical protein